MATPALKSSTETYFEINELGNKIYVQGTTVPTDTAAGYEKGCTFVDMDVASGTSGVYFNKGTNASCVFELAPVASTGTVTTLTATSASATNIAAGPNGTTNPTFVVDSSTASQASGLKIVGATAAGTVAAVVISSGADASLTINAKGTGTIGIGSVSTGAVTITPATTVTGALTASAGVAATGAVTATTFIRSSGPTSGVGYATGAGGTVTQITNRSTGVTLSKVTGTITTDTTSLAAGAAATFTVTNTAVAIGDLVILNIRSGATTSATVCKVNAVAAGSFDITVINGHASTAETGAIIINFAVIKGVTA